MAHLHRARSNPRLGFLLAVATTVLWGFLSIALKLLLEGMDGLTITWYRLGASGILLGAFQAFRKQLPALGSAGRITWTLLAIALFGLLGNYVLFVISLEYIAPATAQLVIQLAPLLFLLGGLFVFGERLTRLQWAGLFLLTVGLLVFFHDRLGALLRLSGREAIGVALVVVAAVVWAAYALAQKQLLVTFSSENILLLIYLGSSIALLPTIRPAQIFELDGFQLGLLVFGVFNTLAAYGCFAEALEHWEASRVSAVIAVTPLITILAVYGILVFWPDADVGERLTSIELAGSVLIVLGSMMTALARNDEREAARSQSP